MSDLNLLSSASKDPVCINYLDFLAASCKKRWRFLDAIYGVMPIFGMVTKPSHKRAPNRQDDLPELALQVLSTQLSDETNIVRLITLAGQLQIDRFDILLPYTLSEQQVKLIHTEYGKPVSIESQGDKLSITVVNNA